MGRAAAGRYLEILLEERKIAIATAARRLGVAPRTLKRWLEGSYPPPADSFHMLVEMVGGSRDQAVDLLMDVEATPADGVRAAGEWLTTERRVQLADLAEKIRTRDELEALIALWGRSRDGVPRDDPTP